MANPVSAIAFRPMDQLIQEADQRLHDVEETESVIIRERAHLEQQERALQTPSKGG